jgi:hypothetical protein
MLYSCPGRFTFTWCQGPVRAPGDGIFSSVSEIKLHQTCYRHYCTAASVRGNGPFIMRPGYYNHDTIIRSYERSAVLVLPARRSRLVIAVDVLKRQNNYRVSLLYVSSASALQKPAFCPHRDSVCVCFSYYSHNKQLFLP